MTAGLVPLKGITSAPAPLNEKTDIRLRDRAYELIMRGVQISIKALIHSSTCSNVHVPILS